MGDPQVRLCVFNSDRSYNILVENQIIKLRVNATSLSHYLSLGYSVKVNEIICVKAKDLTIGSDKEVNIICDYCGKEFSKQFKKYIKSREFVPKDSCFDCFSLKQKDVVNYKYGVDSTMQLDENKQKSLFTIRRKYGVDNVMQSDCVREIFENSMLKKYGCKYAQQSEAIRLKTQNNNIKKYGVKNPVYVPEFRRKMNNCLHVNGIRVSKNQLKIAEYLNGALNVNIDNKYADIVLLNDNIIIEYDGSGHYLSVRFGRISQEEFEIKDRNRIESFINLGYKCLIIRNNKEKFISDNVLHDIKIIKNKLNDNNNLLFYDIS